MDSSSLRAQCVVPAPEAAPTSCVAPRSPKPADLREPQLYSAPESGDYVMHDFAFASGEKLAECRVHYTTLGQPSRDASGEITNAIVVLHGTGYQGKSLLKKDFADVLFAPGGLLDSQRHYIILPDSIGHGGSSKPSDGLRAKFPRYGYNDMVTAQYRLVTEQLGVKHVRLVMGTSMGGMHTWLWGVRYPSFMDALFPLACAPAQIAGRNRVLRRMLIDTIRNDPEWRQGTYLTQPRGLMTAAYLLSVMSSSPLAMHKRAPTLEAADQWFETNMPRLHAGLDANDMLYQWQASFDYDPSPSLESIQVPLTTVNTADDTLNPPELGIVEASIARVPRGEFVLLPITDETRGHPSHSKANLWKEHLASLLARSEPTRRVP